MKSKLALWAACLAAVGTAFGCHADDAAKNQGAQNAAPTAQKPMKAMTPSGEEVWIVAVWDADAKPCDATKKACKNTKCWQTKDGKTLCVKPLKSCSKKGGECASAEHFKCKKSGKVMCTQDQDGMACAKGCPMAAKEVKACPKNGSAKCGAKEHVSMPDGKKGCAPADLKQANAQAQANPNAPVDMGDEVVEDDVFLITAAD